MNIEAILQEIEYAVHHGWPHESLKRLENMAAMARKRAAVATPSAEPAVMLDAVRTFMSAYIKRYQGHSTGRNNFASVRRNAPMYEEFEALNTAMWKAIDNPQVRDYARSCMAAAPKQEQATNGGA